MGFSQGASLAASLILHHQIEHPFAPPLFRFAIFICSTYAHSRSISLGKDVTEHVKPNERPPLRRKSTDSGYESDDDVSSDTVRLFCVESEKTKIQIPTAHIYGSEDKLMHESVEVELMCDKRVAFSYKHKGGHDVPMDAVTSKGIRDTVALAIDRCETFS
ncbi:hypothetical protein MMC12_003933 [Toensbergia leucococca]|nr:hypothetical protein [Toensbergia leucococca]